jgi:hypothetical protein
MAGVTMLPMFLSLLVAALPGVDVPASDDVRTLIATIEALQQPLDDFRCEFEGSIRFKGKNAEVEGKKGTIAEDGLSETFSGVFIWRRGGDCHCDTLNRRAVDNRIEREGVVVRMKENQAESYGRGNDLPVGRVIIKTPRELNSYRSNCLGSIFLIVKIKRDADTETMELSVGDDEVEGRPLKVLTVWLKNKPGSEPPRFLFGRYWIDLRRNGHVVRHEAYSSGELVAGRLDIKLAPFKVGDVEVWMPIAGENVGYMAFETGRPFHTNEPQSIVSIYVVDGTMEFNKRPGPEAFTIKYKLGTPVSDHLRKTTYEFGQQKVPPKPTKAQVEKMLKEQVAKAEEQKRELTVASSSEGFDWSSWMLYGFGALVLVSSVALLIQRARR